MPHMRITHSMVLSEVAQGGDAWSRVCTLIEDASQSDEEKLRLLTRAEEIFATLIAAGVVERREEAGEVEYVTTIDLPEDFALDQPLSPFLLAALELLDPESETYALDVISMVESTLDDPRQVLRAQERKARDAAIASMKADGIEYEERMERLEEVTYPKPLEELLDAAYERYCQDVPWARDFELSPKSVLRDMIETVSDFKGVRRGATASPVPRARFTLPVRRLPRSGAHGSRRQARRSPARCHRVAGVSGSHGRLELGRRMEQRGPGARHRGSFDGGGGGARPSRADRHGKKRAVLPCALGFLAQGRSARRTRRRVGAWAFAVGPRRSRRISPSTTRSASIPTRGRRRICRSTSPMRRRSMRGMFTRSSATLRATVISASSPTSTSMHRRRRARSCSPI